MNNQILENQAWSLLCALNELLRVSTNPRPVKLCYVHSSAYRRWLRRQRKLFNYDPGGFASLPAQPSGVLGQGALL